MQRLDMRSAAIFAFAIIGTGCGPGYIGDGRESYQGADGSPRLDDPTDLVGTEFREAAEDPSLLYDSDAGIDEPVALPPPSGDDPDRPWAHNTGPSDPSKLVASGSLSITTDGAVYENLDITGDIWIDANNVTIRNFRVDGRFSSTSFYGINIAPGNRGILLEDGEILRTGNGIRGLGYTARRMYIHDNNDDGLRPEGVRGSGPTLVEHCFIESMGLSDGAHADALQVSGVSDGSYDVTLRHNNFYMPAPGTPEHPGDASKASAVIFLAKPVSNYLIENNWMTGGGYTIYCGGNTADVLWRNNIFGGAFDYGPITGTCQNFTGNVWEDTGSPVPN